MSITYTQANKILDLNFGNTTYTVASPLYFGLSTTPINNDGTGATEPSGGAYARVAVTNSKSYFSVASSGVLSNSGTITFAESTASWGTITYVFIADALTSGNILYFDALTTSRAVPANTTVYFGSGNVSISMTNA